MAFDQNTLLDVIMEGQELLDGLRNDMPNLDDRICKIRPTDATSGTFPYLAPKDTLGDDNGAKALGAEPDLANFELSSLSFEVEQYGKKMPIPKSVLIDANQYMDTLGEMAETLLESNAVAREKDLAALMTDSTYAQQQAAQNGTWDGSTSTPVKDILLLKENKVPKIDTVVMGSTTALELKVHPDITAKAGIGYASGTAIGDDALKSIIGGILGVDPSRVFIWDTFYNSANYGQSATLARVTSDFFWAGQQKSLNKVQQNGMKSALTLIESHTAYEQAVVDVCDFVAPPAATFMGGEITGL